MRLRLPVAWLAAPAMVCGVFALISGGVAVTQGPNAVWWPCGAFTAGLVVCVVLWKALPVDWIGDKEIEAVERREDYAAINRQLLDGTFGWKDRIRTKLLWGGVFVVIALQFALEHEVVDPSGSRDGMTAAGFKLGLWHVLGRDWTGVELLLIAPLVVYLLWTLRRGFSTILDLQKKPGPRD